MTRFLDHPVISYLIVSVISLGVAVICFLLGDSLAQVSGTENTFLGLGFKASGAIGSFFLVFMLSLRGIKRLREVIQIAEFPVKVYLTGEPEDFSMNSDYTCQAVIFDGETGDRSNVQVDPRWEAGYLTLDFRGIRPQEYLGAKITDGQERTWQLPDFRPLESKRECTIRKTD